jgi:hypothetical protein
VDFVGVAKGKKRGLEILIKRLEARRKSEGSRSERIQGTQISWEKLGRKVRRYETSEEMRASWKVRIRREGQDVKMVQHPEKLNGRVTEKI